jgi:hypothetical protein
MPIMNTAARIAIWRKGMESIAVLYIARHHPHPERIALGVDHQHTLSAIDGRAVDPVRAAEPTRRRAGRKLLVGVVPARAALRAGLHALRVDDRGRRPGSAASRKTAAGDQNAQRPIQHRPPPLGTVIAGDVP